MLWIKSLHLISIVAWFAGLLYLPRLYVYHAQTGDAPGIARFCVMEGKLFWGIMTPSALLVIASGAGLWLLSGAYFTPWLALKLVLVALLMAHHIWCYRRLRDFARDRNRHSHIYYRWLNEAPALLLIGIIILAVVKPF